jgi:shikimate dehydrogenase
LTKVRYAEVIGDPIAQSKSPIIHRYWLDRLKLTGDYRRTQVPNVTLADFIAGRREDANWLGCNVTIPHKEKIIALLDRLDSGAEAIGAVNCIVPQQGSLIGYNTDIDGVAAALDSTPMEGRAAAIIGAGGGARAAVSYVASRGARITILVRNPSKAEQLCAMAPSATVTIGHFNDSASLLPRAAAIINASPLGMAGAEPMPRSLLNVVRSHAAGATVFDMVTTPAETEFLSAGRAGGGRTVDGLTMLIGQAARAFELFFCQAPPPPDTELRDLLVTDSRDSA